MAINCPTRRMLAACRMGATTSLACAQGESVFVTVPASTVGTHLNFTNLEGSAAFTRLNLFGAATHSDWTPPDPPAPHTLVIAFEWMVAAGTHHTFDDWSQSSDYISTVVGGMTNTFSTGFAAVPGAWDTVAVHLYAGFPISVSAAFDHRWVPTPGPVSLLAIGSLLAARRRR